MRVQDPKKLLKLMAIQEVSARTLAEEVGYNSHSYITRILRGEITTVTPERAARIARFFGVGIDDLFVARLSSDGGPSVQRKAS